MKKDFECFKLSSSGSVEAGILKVELNRPKVNAMNKTFFVELENIFNSIAVDSNVRAVIISSKYPKFFSAGLDLKDISIGTFGEKDPARDAISFLNSDLNVMQRCFTAIEKCNKPTICCLGGFCIGGAIDLATACDIRLCSKDALFSVREVVVGLAADMGTLQRLPKVVGNQSWVRDICLTGRDFDWKEALDFGLVSHVFETRDDLLKGAFDLAALISSRSPVATLGTKHLLIHARDHTVQDGLDYTKLWNSVMLNTPDVMESGQAIFTKQTPVFSKL